VASRDARRESYRSSTTSGQKFHSVALSGWKEDFSKYFFICVSKMNRHLMGLDWNDMRASN